MVESTKMSFGISVLISYLLRASHSGPARRLLDRPPPVISLYFLRRLKAGEPEVSPHSPCGHLRDRRKFHVHRPSARRKAPSNNNLPPPPTGFYHSGGRPLEHRGNCTKAGNLFPPEAQLLRDRGRFFLIDSI